MGRHIRRKYTLGVFLFLLGWAASLLNAGSVSAAASESPPGPDRYIAVPVQYTIYEWWLLSWDDNQTVCVITTEHEGLPTLGEIYVDCGEYVYDAWMEQPPCPPEIYSDDPSTCPGYYIHLASSTPAERDIAIALPPPVVWVTLKDCIPESTTNRCASAPTLVLTGDEPVAGERILQIVGEIDGDPFTCDAHCELPLPDTDEEGIPIEFWAYSSYGDSSNVFDAQVRVIFVEEDDTDEPFWYVDALSSQWRGAPAASCAESWQAFPPVGGPPDWLSTPDNISNLESGLAYSYLAGNLINQGLVDASACQNFGLLANGQANTCGVEVAMPAITEWQNRFDTLIMEAAQETSIPANLLKNLFARESQFWPGVFNEGGDIGLGQLTEDGADIALLWNPSFFEQFCPLILEDEDCQKGYLHLTEEQRVRLRGALVYSVNATCADCPLGLDLTQANLSISVFAHTLLGSCEQAGRVVQLNTGGDIPGAVSNYEDLWKFTLINYNAGAGCLGLAIDKTDKAGDPIDWEHVSANLTEVCQRAKDYVEDITLLPTTQDFIYPDGNQND